MIAATIMFIINEPIALSNAASDLDLKAFLHVEEYEADFVDPDPFPVPETGFRPYRFNVRILTTPLPSSRTGFLGLPRAVWLLLPVAFQHWALEVEGTCYELASTKDEEGRRKYGIIVQTSKKWHAKHPGARIFRMGPTRCSKLAFERQAEVLWESFNRASYRLGNSNCQNFVRQMICWMTVMDEVNSQLHSFGQPHQLHPSAYVRLVLSRVPTHFNFFTQLIWFVCLILTLSFATPFHLFSAIWLPGRPVAQLLLEVYLHMCVLGVLASFLTFPRKSLDTYWEQFPKFEDLDTIWVSKFLQISPKRARRIKAPHLRTKLIFIFLGLLGLDLQMHRKVDEILRIFFPQQTWSTKMRKDWSEFVMIFAGAGSIYTCGEAMLVICSMAIMTAGIQFISIMAHTWELSWKMCLWLGREWIRQKHGSGSRQEAQRKKKV